MSHENSYEQAYESYSEDNAPRRVRASANSSRRSFQTTRRGKSPQSVNGLHRRRRRKISW